MTTKTMAGIAAVLCPFAVLLGVIWFEARTVKGALAQAGVSSDVSSAVLGPFSSLTLLSILLFLCAVLLAVGFLVFFGYGIARPLRSMSQALREADISQDLSLSAGSNEVSQNYNTFVHKLREILGHTRKAGIEVAVGATKVDRFVDQSRVKSKKQGELSDAIFFASVEANKKLVDVATHTRGIHQSTTQNLSTAKTSLEELRKVTLAMDRANKNAAQFGQTIERLTNTSRSIHEIVALIADVSDQTHRLALRAGTEASRPGDKAQGMAALAEELKKLAQKASGASGGQILVNITGMVRDVSSAGKGIHENMGQMNGMITNTSRHFEGLVRAFEENHEQLSSIATAIEELSSKNRQIHGQVTDIREFSKQIEVILSESATAATAMRRKSEALLETVSHFKVGKDPLEETVAWACEQRDLVQAKIEELSKKGVDVFDRSYKPIPGTNPQKYRTSYNAYFDRELRPILDRAIQQTGNTYCLATDVNGYIGTHHSHTSKPLTGSYEVDLLNSREKRLWNTTEMETRLAKNTNPFVLQTYSRDTGEILNDISVPIYIAGKHWGNLRTAMQPTKLLSGRA